MSQDQQKQKPADRVYLAQDDYPESSGFGTFGAAYRRTYYDVVRGSAIPRFDRGERDRRSRNDPLLRRVKRMRQGGQ